MKESLLRYGDAPLALSTPSPRVALNDVVFIIVESPTLPYPSVRVFSREFQAVPRSAAPLLPGVVRSRQVFILRFLSVENDHLWALGGVTDVAAMAHTGTHVQILGWVHLNLIFFPVVAILDVLILLARNDFSTLSVTMFDGGGSTQSITITPMRPAKARAAAAATQTVEQVVPLCHCGDHNAEDAADAKCGGGGRWRCIDGPRE